MFSTTVLDHFEHPRHAGELPSPAVRVETSNPVCGDLLALWVLIEGDRIREIRFKAKGCVAAIASGSMVTEMARGKTLDAARRILPVEIATALGGLPPESGHAAELAAEALQQSLRQAPKHHG